MNWLLVVVAAVAVFLLLRAMARRRTGATMEPMRDPLDVSEEQTRLARFNLTLDATVTDPQTALLGGMVMAAIIHTSKLFDDGRLDEALTALDSVIANPQLAKAERFRESLAVVHCLRGLVYERQQRFTEASNDASAALGLTPENPLARDLLARVAGRG